MQQVSRAAAESVHIVVSGEPGTGRETIAREIHEMSRQRGGPFLILDCARSPRGDVEALLFATNGRENDIAVRRTLERVGRSSHLFKSKGGTLFLRHVVDLPARTQIRLARVLRDGEVITTDEGTHIDLDHRIVTEGNAALDSAIADGRLLPDLWKRLCGIRIDVPPLRARREDIPGLAEHFIRRFCERVNTPAKSLSEPAVSLLCALPWTRNAHELKDLLEGIAPRVRGKVIEISHVLAGVELGSAAARIGASVTLHEARKRFESEYIAAVLMQHRGRIPDAAKTLGIQRSNLYRKIRRLKVPRNIKSGQEAS